MKNELKIREYEMLRQEILQYLDKYQVVRNMMYVITVILLGFCLTGKNTIVYAYLLPLIVILPSYITAYDYWKCTTKLAAYLIVFHERDKKYPYQWEIRKNNFNENNHFLPKNDYQELPYISCYICCISLYFFKIDYSQSFYIQLIIGIITICIGIIIFIRFRGTDVKKYIDAWEKVKRAEFRKSSDK